MNDKEKVIENLNIAKYILAFQQMLSPEMRIRIGQAISTAIDLLKEQEQRINELEEKLRLMEYGDQDTLQSGMMPAT